MRIPLNWLKEYVDIKVSPEKMAEDFLMSGTEGEILKAGIDIDGKVVVGEVMSVKKHPNADRLNVAIVRVSTDRQPQTANKLQIVCGGINLEVGQKVPVALVGAMVGDFEINPTEIRGVKSHGMICSESELGISDNVTGEIMVLGAGAKVGVKVGDEIGKGEVIFDAELTPNRGDLLSMIGMARDYSAFSGAKLKKTYEGVSGEIKIKESKEKISDYFTAKVEAKDLCARYMLRVIKIKQNGESPKWMQKKLEAAGMRPINALVDITNYVMLELGQPLHAFDMQKFQPKADEPLAQKMNSIVVRSAKEKEVIETLDGAKRSLTKEDVVITDGESPIAIAGVMGGKNSEVDGETKTVLLEAATFDKTSIRKTAQRLALRSESSNRFEKGIPTELNGLALERAAGLISEICGGEIMRGSIDIISIKDNVKNITLNLSKVENLIGEKIGKSEIYTILKSLGFVVSGSADKLEVTVPWWRLDVSIEEDLVEEIARNYGYDKIKSTIPAGNLPGVQKNPTLGLTESTRDSLVGLGFSEIINYSFISEKDYKNAGIDDKKSLRIANPLSSDQELMRTSLVPSILKNITRNQANFDEIRIFEVAKVYVSKGSKDLPIESLRLAGALSGGENLGIKYGSSAEFYAVKGVLENLFQTLGITNVQFRRYDKRPFQGGRSAEITVSNKILGVFGEIDDEARPNFGIKKKVAVFDIDLEKVADMVTDEKVYESIPRFPGIGRDLSVVVDEGVEVESILGIVKDTKADNLYSYKVSDIYKGKGLEEGKKSITLSLGFLSKEKTLEDREIDSEVKEIIKSLKARAGGALRDDKRREE